LIKVRTMSVAHCPTGKGFFATETLPKFSKARGKAPRLSFIENSRILFSNQICADKTYKLASCSSILKLT